MQTSNCLHVCFPCEPTIPIWNFSLDFIQVFFSSIKCSRDFSERSSIPYSYSLVDNLEKTSEYKIITFRKGRDSTVSSWLSIQQDFISMNFCSGVDELIKLRETVSFLYFPNIQTHTGVLQWHQYTLVTMRKDSFI